MNEITYRDNQIIKFNTRSVVYPTLEVTIDAEDWDLIKMHTWYLLPRRDKTGKYYVYAHIWNKDKRKWSTLYLHRHVMNVTDPLIEVDHKNNDTLNCRKLNLRESTRSQNSMNQIVNRANNTSGYKGVSFDKRRGKYKAYIWLHKKQVNLGYYSKTEEAAARYNRAARKYFGEFAKLNVITKSELEKSA